MVISGALALAGCGGPVEIEVPELSGEDAATCADLAADLPETLGDEERVESEPADAPGAAYGDPPIVVTCGADGPEGFAKGAQCELVNDVAWYIPSEQYDDLGLDLVITSAWHRPRLQVVVPDDYRGTGAEAGIMAQLSPLVEEHLTEVARCDA